MDKSLLEAIRGIPGEVEDIGKLTSKQVIAMLEKRFSCSLENRKKFIKAELVEVVQTALGDGESSSSSSSSSAASDSDGGDASKGEQQEVSSSPEDSDEEATAALDHDSEQEGQKKQQPTSDQDSSDNGLESPLSDDAGELADMPVMPRP
ncbi:unnamed protein product, partial [Ectocarpus sp. 13 AM-2016]